MDTIMNDHLQQITLSFKNEATKSGWSALAGIEFLAAHIHTDRVYKVKGGVCPESPPTIWTLQIRLAGGTFTLSRGEFYDAGLGGWEESPWGVNGRYEYGNGGDYITESLYGYILASSSINQDIKNKVQSEGETIWGDQFNDPFQSIAKAIELHELITHTVQLTTENNNLSDTLYGNSITFSSVDESSNLVLQLASGDVLTVPRGYTLTPGESKDKETGVIQIEYCTEDIEGSLEEYLMAIFENTNISVETIRAYKPVLAKKIYGLLDLDLTLSDLNGFKRTAFLTNQTDLMNYNQQPFQILRALNKEEVDLIVAPMFEVEFCDGFKTAAYIDEVYTDSVHDIIKSENLFRD
ncbi:hypothetical protein [Paenibacillus terrae]|uniref:Uncharacterized protein n=1 Tax=Paenibacillus terrae TaxID=159743 RepID=A0A0D7WVK0_9BACL|nr:hypothetical protein [Paenibacillus terrae]KJD43019.1 hypothetical protein QD47_24975 [Paenibacillus terrae]